MFVFDRLVSVPDVLARVEERHTSKEEFWLFTEAAPINLNLLVQGQRVCYSPPSLTTAPGGQPVVGALLTLAECFLEPRDFHGA